jgi:hypothetical protein
VANAKELLMRTTYLAALYFDIRYLRTQLARPKSEALGEDERIMLFRELVGSLMLRGVIRRQSKRRRSSNLIEK